MKKEVALELVVGPSCRKDLVEKQISPQQWEEVILPLVEEGNALVVLVKIPAGERDQESFLNAALEGFSKKVGTSIQLEMYEEVE